MKAIVDQNLCMGCGICTSISPEGFEIGEDGIAKGKETESECDIKEAALSCPEQAITIK